MRRLIVPLLFVCLPTLASAQAVDNPDSRRVQAERYMQATDLPKMLSDSTAAMTQNLPPDKAAELRALMSKYVRVDALREAMLTTMVKHFTTRELAALANFYGSPEGKSALQKFGPYMADIMPLMQAEMRRAAEQAQAEKSKKPGN
jgi:hypothetical protein